MKCLGTTVHDGHFHHCMADAGHYGNPDAPCAAWCNGQIHQWKDGEMSPLMEDGEHLRRPVELPAVAPDMFSDPAAPEPVVIGYMTPDGPVVAYDPDEFRAAQNEEWDREEEQARSAGVAWQPASPGDTPGELAPGEDDITDEPVAMPVRKWGDEPDPLPAPPTVLVASTDPHVNADGEAAKQYAPKPAQAVATKAFAGGWRYEWTYAAASVAAKGEPGKRGHKPAHVLHTVALRLARDTHRDSIATALGEAPPEDTIRERGYAIWAREDAINEPVEGAWRFGDAVINGRSYGARELAARLLRQGREILDDPPADVEANAPTAGEARERKHAKAVAQALAKGETPPPAPSSAPASPPLAPILPGTWGALHVGDTITGNDGQPYVVRGIESTGVWVGSGSPELLVAIGPAADWPAPFAGEPYIMRQPANAPIVPASHGDHADIAPALDAITAGGMSAQPIEESASTVDQFSDPATAPAALTRREPPTGQYNWYKLVDPTSGNEGIFPRVSTIIKTLSNEGGLTKYEAARAIKGLAISPDLIAATIALDPERDKGKLYEIVDQAANKAGRWASANMGTAVDKFTERLDAGESIASMGVPDSLRPVVEAYAATLARYGLEVLPELTQRTILNVTHAYAGTWDRVVRRRSDGKLFVLDVKTNKPDEKTGDVSDFHWLEWGQQFAMYARGEHMCNLDFTGYEPMPPLDQALAFVLHLPLNGTPGVYEVDIIKGWVAAKTSIKGRALRTESRGGWSRKLDAPAPAPAPLSSITAAIAQEIAQVPTVVAAAHGSVMPAVHDLVSRDIALATTLDELRTIAGNAISAGVWTDALGALALHRDDEIRARTAVDHAALAALWAELTPVGRWTINVQHNADARAAELAQLVAA